MNSRIDLRALKEDAVLQLRKADPPGSKAGFWDFLNKDISFGSGMPDKIRENFYLELNSLLGAGIDIRSAMELIAENQTKKKHKEIFNAVLHLIIAGDTFSNALKKVQKFSLYEYYSIQIGEETGKLVEVLKELADYFKKKIKQRRQIIGAITYPAIVLVVAFGAVSFMIAFVVPMFSDVFKRFGGDLPLPTKAVVALSAIVKKYIGAFLFFTIALCISFFTQRKKVWFRKSGSRIVMRIPFMNDLLCKIYVSRFSNTMALLIGSKVPILKAIQMSRQMIGFYPIEHSLFAVEERILAGDALYKGLAEHSVYPKKMIAMLKVGEDVNQLDAFFSKIAEQYANDVEYQTSLLSKFIEPLIIVVLGLVVGIILIAMYLPLFKLGQAF
jgi:type IV pilus assembly protein PilC